MTIYPLNGGASSGRSLSGEGLGEGELCTQCTIRLSPLETWT